MFYEPVKQDHGLPKNPFNSLVIPRPIGWITTVDPEGVVNLAPYSFFNAVGYRPPTVMFASGAGSGEDGQKDSLRNVEATGEFVCNLSTWETREAMNRSSASVGPEAPVHLECKHLRSVDFPNWSNKDRYVVVFGEVIGVHIEDQYITPEGLIDVDGMKPIGRLGYDDYTIVGGDSIFTMTRPE